MPLIKRPSQAVAQPATAAQAVTQSPLATTQASAAIAAPKDILVAAKGRAIKDSVSAPMTKDTYWERKEARDIRTGECIRLSGVLQALLGSVNYGQYCTTADRTAYLAQVKSDAKELAKFITEEA